MQPEFVSLRVGKCIPRTRLLRLSAAVTEPIFGWRSHYIYGKPALRPFSRTMTEEEAKKKDLMGRIPGILEPNP